MTLANVQEGAYDYLKYINTNFVQSDASASQYLGGDIGTLANKFSPTNFVSKLFSGYTDFNTQFSAEFPVISPGDPAFLPVFKYRDISGTTKAWSSFTSSIPPTMGANNYEFIFTNVTGNLKAKLDEVMKAYSLLEPRNYAKFTSGLSGIEIRDYSTADASTLSGSTDKATLQGYINTLFGSTVDVVISNTTDLFVVRRVLQLYIAMANCYIAMKLALGDTVTTVSNGVSTITVSPTANRKKALDLTYQYLRKLNLNVMGDNVKAIKTETNKRVRQFAKNGAEINTLDSDVTELKGELVAKKDQLDSAKSSEGRGRTVTYWGVGIAITLLLAACMVFIAPVEPLMKKLVIGGIAVLAVVALLVLRYAYKRVTESFVTSVYAMTDYNAAVTQDSMISNTNTFSISVMRDAVEYLSNTIQLALTLSSYKGYGNMNMAMSRDINNFISKKDQMITSTELLNQSKNIVGLQSSMNSARLTLFLSLLVIVLSAFFGILATKSMSPIVQNTIYITATIAVVIAAILYFIDTSSRVRTDSQKIYWGSPDTSGLS